MNKQQKRKWESAKRRQQEDRRKPTYHTGVDSFAVLRDFLPEASSDVLSRLRREPERLTFWQRAKMFFTG